MWLVLLVTVLSLALVVRTETTSKLNLHKPKGHAVVYSDLKLDDTSAIKHLAKSGQYDRVHVVGTAVHDHERAHGHLRDFVKQQGIEKGKVKYYSGGKDIVQQDPNNTHEKNFQGGKVPVTLNAKKHLAANLPKGSNVDAYKIAPTDPKHIHRLIGNRNIKLGTFHQLDGYNSLTDVQSHRGPMSKQTEKSLTQIQSRIKSTHPQADVIFSNNQASFTDNGGSTMPLSKLKGKYPDNHLKAAQNDPFHDRTLRNAESIVKHQRKTDEKGKVVPPHLHPGEHDPKYRGKSLPSLINQARFDEPHDPKEAHKAPLRNHFNKYLDHAEPIVAEHGKNPKLNIRLKTGVREAFTKEGRLEMCDGAHVACVNHARNTGDHSQFKPATFHRDTEKDGPNAIMRLKPAGKGDPVHGHMLVGQTGEKAANLLLHNHPHGPQSDHSNSRMPNDKKAVTSSRTH